MLCFSFALLPLLGSLAKDIFCKDGPPILTGEEDFLRKVAFTSRTEQAMCKHEPPIEQQNMVTACDRFCAINGQGKSVPFLMGSETYSFNMQEISAMCLGGFAMDSESKLQECNRKSGALKEIEIKASDFVEAVSVFKYDQLAFVASMLSEADKLQERLASQDFEVQMDKEVNKAGLLKQEFETFKRNSAGAGAKSKLEAAMVKLKGRGEALKQIMISNLPMFEDFVDNCNTLILSRGSEFESILDICAQKNAACIDEDGAGHVACCCAVNPVTLEDSYYIDGLLAFDTENGSARVGAGRRMTGTTETIDVCARARQQAQGEINEAKASIEAANQQTLVDKKEAAKRYKYGQYFEACPTGRRLSANDTSRARVRSGQLTGTQTQAHTHANKSTSRRLDGRTCTDTNETIGGSTLLMVLGEKAKDESNMCKHPTAGVNSGEPLDQAYMVDACSSFCSPNGVSMLMGTPQYGFNKDQADGICTPHGDVLKYDAAQLKTCEDYANSFSRIEEATASFLTTLDVFKSARIAFTAATQEAVQKLQEHLNTDEFLMQMDKEVDKGAYFLQEVKKELDAAVYNNAELKSKSAELRAKMENLDDVLRQSVEELAKFLDECNDLYLATSDKGELGREYLLDICAQGNSACFDQETSVHVSCCCAFNPVTLLGQWDAETQIINGLDAPSRRLSDLSQNKEYDICAEAWTAALPDVTANYDKARSHGGAQLISEFVAPLASEYGSSYCGYDGSSAANYIPTSQTDYSPASPITTPAGSVETQDVDDMASAAHNIVPYGLISMFAIAIAARSLRET